MTTSYDPTAEGAALQAIKDRHTTRCIRVTSDKDQRAFLRAGRHDGDGDLIGAGKAPPVPGEEADMVAVFRNYLYKDEPWRARAKCLEPDSGVTVDDFFPVRGSSQKKAKAICARCPVAEECDDYATRSNSTYGIWGGEIRHRGKSENDETEVS